MLMIYVVVEIVLELNWFSILCFLQFYWIVISVDCSVLNQMRENQHQINNEYYWLRTEVKTNTIYKIQTILLLCSTTCNCWCFYFAENSQWVTDSEILQLSTATSILFHSNELHYIYVTVGRTENSWRINNEISIKLFVHRIL